MNYKLFVSDMFLSAEKQSSGVWISIKYAFFALLAIAVNIIIQIPFFIFSDNPWTVYLALLFGTVGGLLMKYELDKRWIFYYRNQNGRDGVRKFCLYSLMGIFTTAIFWGFEIFFYRNFNCYCSQYVGGILGLVIGYVIKYYLDKNFVFNQGS